MAIDQNELRANLRNSSLDSFLSSAMVGAGETFFPAFALALGATDASSGLLTALPFMIGSFVQLGSPHALFALGSYRKWIVAMCALQAACFVPLALIALSGHLLPLWLLYLVVTMYWCSGLAAGPAWSSWLGTLVPVGLRPKFFAKRSHLGQAGLITGMFISGTGLQIATHFHFELIAFAMVFILAGVLRLGSAICLAKQSEKPGIVRSQRPMRLWSAFAHALSKRKGQGRLIRFMLLFSVSVNISSPFFNAFMLKRLSLEYAAYMGLILASMLAKMLILAVFEKKSFNFNPLFLMKVGLFGAALSPISWVFSSNYIYLLVIQLFGGAMWGIYELGLMLVLYAVIRDEDRTSVLSVFNFSTAVTMLLGTSIGGSILSYFHDSMSAYFLIFSLSTVARLLTTLPFFRAAGAISQDQSVKVRDSLAFQ